ncbi:MAG: hypothetical protein Q9159_007624 [Coniocarpon cinnabarinum]
MDSKLSLDLGDLRNVPPDFRAGLKRPTEIAHFSFDENHVFRPDRSQLKYYYNPELGTNLSNGLESFRKFDDSVDLHLHGLLDAIMLYEQREGKRLEADFVLTMPYESDPFEFNATRFQNTIFLESNHAFVQKQKAVQDAQQRSNARGPSPSESSFWGYKFEALSLLPKTWDSTPREIIEGRVHEQVSNYEQYCSVVQTGIADCKVVLGGEVDGVWDAVTTISTESETDLRHNYVELKTAQQPDSHPISQQRFERKLNRHWAQSYLLGVPKILFGFRSKPPNPRLLKIETFETKDIPAMAQKNHKTWESRPCLFALYRFLDFLKVNMVGRDGVWKIRCENRRITLQQVETEGTGPILKPEFLAWRSTFPS